MNFDVLREYALKKSHATESQPFGDDVLVFKVMNKIFMMMDFEIPTNLNLKCDPEIAVELRERYNAVLPGHHMNKKHWNTIILDNTIPPKEILKMVDNSYNLVVKSLPKSKREKYFDK